MAKKVSIEVEIKNIKKVADLKNELKSLRKEQIQNMLNQENLLLKNKKNNT